MEAVSRLLKAPEMSFFLLGPRGTGKSTWTEREFPDALRLDLRDGDLLARFSTEPAAFRRRVLASEARDVVIDEVQYLPGLLNEVHRLLDAGGRRFVLLGSSARKIRRAGINLLGGRAASLTMFPFLRAELGPRWNLTEALRIGTLPVVLASPEPELALDAYVSLYLRDEIAGEAEVKRLPDFARFLSVAAALHGQAYNATGIARDASVPRTVVEGYFAILEDTLLGWKLPGFEPRLRVKERSHPKWFFVDPGLVRAARRAAGGAEAGDVGALLEGLVIAEVRAHFALRREPANFSYWSPHGTDAEVDLVVERDGECVAIEVKASATIDNRRLKGLRAIAPLEGLRRRILVAPVPYPERTEDGIEIMPVDEFLQLSADRSLFE